MSMRRAINEKCKDCIYDPLCGGGNWRQQVEACTIKSCSLWPYRPKSRPHKGQGSLVQREAESALLQTEEA
jgi:hypothetical protein